MAKIDIYTDMMCSYCALAKRLLTEKQAHFNEIDVSSNKTAREEMRQRTNGQRTVPQIFINNLGIGGYDALYALDKTGQLDQLLAQEDSLKGSSS